MSDGKIVSIRATETKHLVADNLFVDSKPHLTVDPSEVDSHTLAECKQSDRWEVEREAKKGTP